MERWTVALYDHHDSKIGLLILTGPIEDTYWPILEWAGLVGERFPENPTQEEAKKAFGGLDIEVLWEKIP